MYWLRYSQMKRDTSYVALVDMAENYRVMQEEASRYFGGIDPEYIDTPFYEYAASDIEHSLDCYKECLTEKEQEQELNYYCKRVLK